MSDDKESDEKSKESVVIGRVRLNEGRDDGDMVREADPRGGVTVHNVNKTQRLIDRMHRFEVIDDRQYDAASYLRDLYEKATLLPPPTALDHSKPLGGGAAPEVMEGLWEAYSQQVRCLKNEKDIVINVVLHDKPTNNINKLRRALDALGDYQGLDEEA